MGDLTHTMTNRRYAEACVGYAESHDQALVRCLLCCAVLCCAMWVRWAVHWHLCASLCAPKGMRLLRQSGPGADAHYLPCAVVRCAALCCAAATACRQHRSPLAVRKGSGYAESHDGYAVCQGVHGLC